MCVRARVRAYKFAAFLRASRRPRLGRRDAGRAGDRATVTQRWRRASTTTVRRGAASGAPAPRLRSCVRARWVPFRATRHSRLVASPICSVYFIHIPRAAGPMRAGSPNDFEFGGIFFAMRLLLLATLLLSVLSFDYDDKKNTIRDDIRRCDQYWSWRRTSCRKELRENLEMQIMLSNFHLAINADKRAEKVHQWASEDRENIVDIPGLTVDTSSPISVAVALMSMVMLLAASVLQCCSDTAHRPDIILSVFFGFSIGMDLLFCVNFPHQWMTCVFIFLFAGIVSCAISIHFMNSDRKELFGGWNWLWRRAEATTSLPPPDNADAAAADAAAIAADAATAAAAAAAAADTDAAAAAAATSVPST